VGRQGADGFLLDRPGRPFYRVGMRFYRKKGTGLRPVSDVLYKCLSGLEAELPFRLVLLWRRWVEVVGEDAAALCKPLGHRKRTLLVGAEDSAALQELVFRTPEMLDAVNTFLGEECFDKVELDLIMRRVPLDTHTGVEFPKHTPRVEKPDRLGNLKEGFSRDTPIGQCYEAYVRFFGKR
jgi:hypothetical protein